MPSTLLLTVGLSVFQTTPTDRALVKRGPAVLSVLQIFVRFSVFQANDCLLLLLLLTEMVMKCFRTTKNYNMVDNHFFNVKEKNGFIS